jgi:hypothetical protein
MLLFRRPSWPEGRRWVVGMIGGALVAGALVQSGCAPGPEAASPAVTAPEPASEMAGLPGRLPKPPAPPRPAHPTKPRPAKAAEAARPGVAAPSPAADKPSAERAGLHTVALPPVPAKPPENPDDLAELVSRPPLAPPVAAPLLVPAGTTPTDARCTEAARAARAAVLSALAVPAPRLAGSDWVEPMLRVTELALVACQGDAPPTGAATATGIPPAAIQAATYWRATAFLLHGQFARAAVHYRRVDGMDGPYAGLAYSKTLADMLDSCAREDRPGLEAWRLGGLLEVRGAGEAARQAYRKAAASDCRALATLAKARLGR